MLIIEVENYVQQLASILQYFKQEADARKQGAVVPIDALSDFMDINGNDEVSKMAKRALRKRS